MDITARLRDSETAPADKPPFTEGGLTQVYAIDIGQVAKVTRTPLAGSYLQLVEDQPGGLGVIELPHLDSGPFLSYGIQWIAFGILAPIGPATSSTPRSGRDAGRRRGQAAEQAPAAPLVHRRDKLADRYGRRR